MVRWRKVREEEHLVFNYPVPAPSSRTTLSFVKDGVSPKYLARLRDPSHVDIPVAWSAAIDVERSEDGARTTARPWMNISPAVGPSINKTSFSDEDIISFEINMTINRKI